MLDSLEVNRILGLLENKVHFLEEFLICSKMLADMTFESHEMEYNNLLETRGQCIEALKSIEETLQVETKAIKGDTLILTDNEEAAVLSAQAKKLVQEILVLDQQNKIAITNELQNIKTKIKALGRGRQGIAGYQAGQRINVAGAYTDSRK